MISIERISAIAPMTGYGHTEIRKMQDTGKQSSRKLDLRFNKLLEEQRRRTSATYESQGKTVESPLLGEKVNLVVEYYQEEKRRFDLIA